MADTRVGSGPNIGHKMKFFYNSGTYSTPVWNEIEEVGDVSLSNATLTTAEMKNRASNFARTFPGVFNPFQFDLNITHGEGETDFDIIRAAFFAQTVKEYAMMDGAMSTGAEGLRCPCLISQMNWDQAMESVSAYSVQLTAAYWCGDAGEGTPDYTMTDPTWYEYGA